MTGNEEANRQPSEWLEIETDVRGGLLSSALSRIDALSRSISSNDRSRLAALQAELLFHTGLVETAVDNATQALQRFSGKSNVESHLNHVLGMAALDAGSMEEALLYIQRALRHAEASGDKYSVGRAHLGLLRFHAESVSGAVPVLSLVRRAVANSGDPHLHVELRLQYAQASASRNSIADARVHLQGVAVLLADFPNLFLQGRLHLALSVTEILCGNPESAIREANQAIGCAEQSGHYKTACGARVNLAHALQLVERFEDARRHLDTVLFRSPADPNIRVCALDCLANLFMAQGRLQDAGDVLAQLERFGKGLPSERSSRWVELTVRQTRVRLLQLKQAWAEADNELIAAVAASDIYQDVSWRHRFPQ